MEARQAAQRVLDHIDEANDHLGTAKAQGFWDMLGGGTLISLFKRNRISKANQCMAKISTALTQLERELKDVQINFNANVSNSFGDQMMNIGFDNIFTDIRVQREIGDALDQLAVLREEILKINKDLMIKLNSL